MLYEKKKNSCWTFEILKHLKNDVIGSPSANPLKFPPALSKQENSDHSMLQVSAAFIWMIMDRQLFFTKHMLKIWEFKETDRWCEKCHHEFSLLATIQQMDSQGGTPGQDWILLSSRLLWSCNNENRVLALGINGTYTFPKVFNMTLEYKDLLPARMSASSMNWVLKRITRFALRSFRKLHTRCLEKGSSPTVGSSKSKIYRGERYSK